MIDEDNRKGWGIMPRKRRPRSEEAATDRYYLASDTDAECIVTSCLRDYYLRQYRTAGVNACGRAWCSHQLYDERCKETTNVRE